jgi:hypothetical protein
MDSRVTWVLYYADGATCSSADGEPTATPERSIVYIWQANGDHCWNADYFFWHAGKGQWLDVDLTGLLDWLVTDARYITTVRIGRRIPKAEWKMLMARVNRAGHG